MSPNPNSSPTPSVSPAASIKSKATKAAKLLRRWSDVDVRQLRSVGVRRVAKSDPSPLRQAFGPTHTTEPKRAEIQAAIKKIVANIHEGIKGVAAEDPAMAPGLAVVGKLTREDEIAAFRRLFITQPGHALGKLIANTTNLTLSHNIANMLSTRFLNVAERTLLFDSLMAEPITANLVKLLSTKRGILRFGLKMRRAMLFKIAAQGRSPQDVGLMSPIETMQASKLLFRKESMTPAQVTVDTILLGIGGQVPALVGGLIQELFVEDKDRVRGFAGVLAVQLSTQLHTFIQQKMPQNHVSLDDLIEKNTRSSNKLVDLLWNAKLVESTLAKSIGADKAKTMVARLQREGARISDLAERLNLSAPGLQQDG